MTTSESGSLARCIRGISAGVMALAIAATFSLPTAVLAKEKPTSKVEVSKKSSKKLSKKSSKSKALAKIQEHQKICQEKRTRQPKKSTAKQAETPANFVWKPSAEPKQAYYVIPHSVAGHVAGKSQNSPDFTQTSATPPPSQHYQPKPQLPNRKPKKPPPRATYIRSARHPTTMTSLMAAEPPVESVSTRIK